MLFTGLVTYLTIDQEELKGFIKFAIDHLYLEVLAATGSVKFERPRGWHSG